MMPAWKRINGLVYAPLGWLYGPGATCVPITRDPYDLRTWGDACARGFATWKDPGGTHISKGGRKERGMSSDGRNVR